MSDRIAMVFVTLQSCDVLSNTAILSFMCSYIVCVHVLVMSTFMRIPDLTNKNEHYS